MPWKFGAAITVAGEGGGNTFHHLDASGRRSIAISGRYVGVAWEDNRDGRPRCYVAFKSVDAAHFSQETRISGDDDAFRPTIVGMNDGRFLLAWEEHDRVWARMVTPGEQGPAQPLSEAGGVQPSVVFQPPRQVLAVWSQRDNQSARTVLARVAGDAGRLALTVVERQVVEPDAQPTQQLYPTLVMLDDGQIVLAWEDRRHGHTTIVYSHSDDERRFSHPTQVNESFWGGRKEGYGRGTGAMRVALAVRNRRQAVAVWADKRDFRSGYDVYAALSDDGATRFGPNIRVQDDFGSVVAQWHPTVTSDRESLVAAAWDDDRDGTPDVWLSWHDGNTWSEDEAIPGAAGPGVQVAPSIAIDESGNLHALWIDKAELNASSRLRYASGAIIEKE